MKVVVSKLFGFYIYFKLGFLLLRKFLKKIVKSWFWRYLVIYILVCFWYMGMYFRLLVLILFVNIK